MTVFLVALFFPFSPLPRAAREDSKTLTTDHHPGK
jgi:hypothetical protein